MLKFMKKYWFAAFFAAMFMIGEVAVDLIQPAMMEKIVNEGILGVNNGGVSDMNLVVSTGIRMILVVICGGTSGILCGVLTNWCGQNFGNEIRKACFERIMHFSFEQTDRFSAGSLITRITSDITQVQNLMMQFTRGGIRCLMFLIGGSFALLRLDMSFRSVIMIAIPLILLDVAFIVWKTNPLFTLLQNRLDSMNSVIQENVEGARVVKAFVREKREEERFGKANNNLASTQLQVLIYLSWMRPVMNIILNIGIAAILIIGAGRVQAGLMAPGTIMAAITYISQILNGLMMLAMIFQSVSRGVASSKRLKEVLDTEPALKDGSKEAPEEKGAISFDHVSFSYPGNDTPVLKDINLEIQPGEFLAVIGSTGSGKSSFVQLIPRFYDVTEGSVRVDGMDVRDYKLNELRSRISYVLQKSELFSTTIKDNIAIGDPEASDEEIEKAARAAQAEEFISSQKHGYDTEVAEGGMSLSGGQRQRTAIARALLKKASIMIFDDSTSALDLKTEKSFREALLEEYPSVTKIIIAQRISSVMYADRIAVINDGELIACDSHENLMKTCEIYQDICNSQMKGGEEDE